MKTKTKSKSRGKASGKKQQKKRIIIASIAVGAAGILGFFGWQYLKKRRETKKANELDEVLKTTSASNTNSYSSSYRPTTIKSSGYQSSANTTPKSTPDKNAFPLSKGSKGNNVKLLQQALIAKYGSGILPRYGADGDFGTETVNALKKAGLPATINESTFNVLTATVKPDATNIGKELYSAANSKNYNKAISLLKQMQTTDDYASANEVFKQNRINGVRQTIVNGLLNVFTSASQKEAIKFEFLRMGLQFDGSKWSLSGFDGKPVVTTEATTVWINATEGVKVPARMVLGNEVTRKLDYTLFENNGKYFLVTTRSVTYLS